MHEPVIEKGSIMRSLIITCFFVLTGCQSPFFNALHHIGQSRYAIESIHGLPVLEVQDRTYWCYDDGPGSREIEVWFARWNTGPAGDTLADETQVSRYNLKVDENKDEACKQRILMLVEDHFPNYINMFNE